MVVDPALVGPPIDGIVAVGVVSRLGAVARLAASLLPDGAVPVVDVHVATVLAISYLRGSSLSLLLPHVIGLGLGGHLVAPAAFLDGLVRLDLDAALPAVASHHDFGALGPEDGDQNGTHDHHSDQQEFFFLGGAVASHDD